MKLPHWSVAPAGVNPVQKANFLNIQLDGFGVGLAAGAIPFLSVFLVRMGASNLQVGLITSLPAITGFLLAVVAGGFLQRQRNIVPWLSTSRLVSLLAYTLAGCVPFLLPRSAWIVAVLVIWAASTVPSLLVNIAFNVVMNAAAGPRLRYELLSRRWSVIGLTTAVAVALAGEILSVLPFPLNYQVVFIALSTGGVISYWFAGRIRLPETDPPDHSARAGRSTSRQSYLQLIRDHKDFTAFVSIEFVYFLGSTLSLPLFPLYYVRQASLSDSWIGWITTMQTATMLIGYSLWTSESRARGSRFVLLGTTLGLSLYPTCIALTHNAPLIALIAAAAGVFQAGLDLVFFDELMKRVPADQSAVLVSIALSAQYLATIIAPTMGTLLAGRIGLSAGLCISGALRFVAFLLFARFGWKAPPMPREK
jgi:hypothetical protein